MNKVPVKDADLQLMSSRLALYETSNGYQNSDSMAFYVREILAPYCEDLRNAMHDPTLPVFLIVDDYSPHNKPELLALCTHHNIHVIWLPPHSSQFRRPLDLGLFGDLKGRYERSRRKMMTTLWQDKGLSIDRAWHGSTCALTVWNSWSAAAIRALLQVQDGMLTEIILSRKLPSTGCSRNPLKRVNKEISENEHVTLFSSSNLVLLQKPEKKP
jgi:hypothetical protein